LGYLGNIASAAAIQKGRKKRKIFMKGKQREMEYICGLHEDTALYTTKEAERVDSIII
jgi:hypothetical protein